MMVGIYIHIPFCLRKCPYCAFYSVPYDEMQKNAYVQALIRNISAYKSKHIFADTVYFGGGTPSVLSVDDVKSIMSAISDSFVLKQDSEVTLEANPSSVTPEKLAGYLSAGINRLSFGVQSANNEELKLLGRLHDFQTAANAVRSALSVGYKNISCDLMIGTPGQTVASILDSSDKIAELGVTHISCYMLKIEKGTAYDCEMIRNAAADDDLSADMYIALCSKLADSGYSRYEISNFAKQGFESRHNLKYWQLTDYIGFGASAHSYFEGKRFYVPSNLNDYIASDSQPNIIEDDAPNPLEEYIMLSLRLKSGVSLNRLGGLGGDAKGVLERIKPYVSAGLIECDGDHLWLTDSGALVSNTLILEVYMAAIGENT